MGGNLRSSDGGLLLRVDGPAQGVHDRLLERHGVDPADGPLTASVELLELLQRYLADDRLAASKLVIVTRRAVATRLDEDVLDLAHAPLWGLVRSTQSEHPDRAITILDLDESELDLRPARRRRTPARGP